MKPLRHVIRHQCNPGTVRESIWDKRRGRGLDTLGAPSGVGLAHVRGGLDGGHELEGDVSDTDDADDAAGDDEPGAVAEDQATDEDVDWAKCVSF